MSSLKLSLFQLDHLIEENEPRIASIFYSKGISSELFSIQWFVTIFSYDVILSDLEIIWELFLLKGWKFILQLSLAIIFDIPKIVLCREPEAIVNWIKNSVYRRSIKNIIKNALKIKIHKKTLNQINEKFYMNYNNLGALKNIDTEQDIDTLSFNEEPIVGSINSFLSHKKIMKEDKMQKANIAIINERPSSAIPEFKTNFGMSRQNKLYPVIHDIGRTIKQEVKKKNILRIRTNTEFGIKAKSFFPSSLKCTNTKFSL